MPKKNIFIRKLKIFISGVCEGESLRVKNVTARVKFKNKLQSALILYYTIDSISELVLGRVFRPKMTKIVGDRDNYIMRSFVALTYHRNIYY
jgi:hypothetical protein